MRILRSATSRFVVLHLFLAAASTALVLAFVYWSTTKLIDAEVRQVVGAEVASLSDEYQRFGILGLSRAIDRRLGNAADRDAVYLLTDRQGQRITGNLSDWPPTIVAGEGWVVLDLFRTDSNRAAPISAASLQLANGERLLVGRDAQARVAFDRTLLRAVFWALGLTTILGLATGWLATRFILRRVDDVTRTADEIVAGDLALRVPVRGGSDEFTRLAETLNRMLDRIEALVSDMRMVTDSVAHDLRSPLTRLRSHLDKAVQSGTAAEEKEALIGSAIGEADEVLRAFTELVEITRAEAGVGRDQFDRVDLGRIVGDAVEVFGPVAEENGIVLREDSREVFVRGHGQLLGQALSNLIENALRHATGGSEVWIEVGETVEGAVLRVSDNGSGIPAADRERVLKRFERLDAARSSPGSGLGLSLVAAVARMHEAKLELGDAGPGLSVTLVFPQRNEAA